MWNVCWRCGLYRADKRIDPDGPFAVCPECGFRHPFRQMPLLLISGASGAGKSTVCQALLSQMPEVVLLDSDIIWRPEFNTPSDNYRAFFETWLRLCKNIAQAGRPVALFGAGVGVPANLEACVERRYFSELHYLALTCQNDILARRLEGRPAWREAGSPRWIGEQVRFNRWFIEQAKSFRPQIECIDTTEAPLADTVEAVRRWIVSRL